MFLLRQKRIHQLLLIGRLYFLQIHLVEQHFNKEFEPYLGRRYKLVQVSGDCEEKDFFSAVLEDSDLVICTAQILENALAHPDEDRHAELSGQTQSHGLILGHFFIFTCPRFDKINPVYLESNCKQSRFNVSDL